MIDGWHVEEARGSRALENVVTVEWRRLESRCSTATPFQSPEWLRQWWRYFEHGHLRIVTVRRAGELEALLPLVIEEDSDGRRAKLLGHGNSDHLDPLIADATRDVAGAVAIAAIAASLGPDETCEFDRLRSTSTILSAPAPAPWSWETTRTDACPVLQLPGSESELGEVISPRLLADLRRSRQRLERIARVRIDSVREDNLESLMQSLVRLHDARWAARGLPGVLGDEATRGFHLAVARAFLESDALRMYALFCAERIVGVFYGLAWRKRTYYYLGGFDPALSSFSVGSLLVEHAIRAAIREGASEFDFLRGGESYKYRWGAQDEESCRRVLCLRLDGRE